MSRAHEEDGVITHRPFYQLRPQRLIVWKGDRRAKERLQNASQENKTTKHVRNVCTAFTLSFPAGSVAENYGRLHSRRASALTPTPTPTPPQWSDTGDSFFFRCRLKSRRFRNRRRRESLKLGWSSLKFQATWFRVNTEQPRRVLHVLHPSTRKIGYLDMRR